MKTMTEQQLLDLKKQIEESKNKVAELKGTEKHLMKELKDDWDCTTLQQAEKKLQELNAKLTETQQGIQTATTELIEKYGLEVE